MRQPRSVRDADEAVVVTVTVRLGKRPAAASPRTPTPRLRIPGSRRQPRSRADAVHLLEDTRKALKRNRLMSPKPIRALKKSWDAAEKRAMADVKMLNAGPSMKITLDLNGFQRLTCPEKPTWAEPRDDSSSSSSSEDDDDEESSSSSSSEEEEGDGQQEEYATMRKQALRIIRCSLASELSRKSGIFGIDICTPSAVDWRGCFVSAVRGPCSCRVPKKKRGRKKKGADAEEAESADVSMACGALLLTRSNPKFCAAAEADRMHYVRWLDKYMEKLRLPVPPVGRLARPLFEQLEAEPDMRLLDRIERGLAWRSAMERAEKFVSAVFRGSVPGLCPLRYNESLWQHIFNFTCDEAKALMVECERRAKAGMFPPAPFDVLGGRWE